MPAALAGVVGGTLVIQSNAIAVQLLMAQKMVSQDGTLTGEQRESLRQALTGMLEGIYMPFITLGLDKVQKGAGLVASLLVTYQNLQNKITTLVETTVVDVIVPPPTGSLEVSPATGLSMTGNVGGPFTPPSQNYTLTNTGGTAISYNISNDQNWVSLSSTGGFLEPGLSTDVLVAINSNAVSLGAGSYSDTVVFTNTLNGNDNTSRSVELTVNATPSAGTLEVSPATGLSMTGDVGGPFSPPSQSYTLTNTGGTTITYTISKSANWVSLESTGGSLEPEASTNVLVAINSNAVSLSAGPYSDTVFFTNTTNG